MREWNETNHPILVRMCLECKRQSCRYGECGPFREALKRLKRTDRKPHGSVKGKLWEYKGESHTAAEWSRILGFKVNTIQKRLWNGWTIEEAIEVPRCGSRRDKNEPTDDHREPDKGSGEA